MNVLRLLEDVAFRDEIEKYITVLCAHWKVPRADVDDIKQDAWAAIVASIHRYSPDKGTPIQFARGVVRNVVREYLRQRALHDAHFTQYHPDINEYPSSAPTPERCAELQQARCKLSIAAEALTPRQLTTVVSFALDDMSHRDIAKNEGSTEGASQKRYERALNQLAKCVPANLLCVIDIPRHGTGCDGSSSRNGKATSQWKSARKWSHYAGLIAAALVALTLCVAWALKVEPIAAITGEIRTGDGHAMYREDNRFFTFGKLSVCPKPPMGKLEPATLPSVSAVTAPTVTQGKRADVWLPSPLPAYKQPASPAKRRPTLWR